MTMDIGQLARACQVLLEISGMEGERLWTARGPSRRASWLKGYLRRSPARADGARGAERVLPAVLSDLSHREKTMLLVAFDLWNRSGEVPFGAVLSLPPRMVTAIAGFMEARCLERPGALEDWIARWSA